MRSLKARLTDKADALTQKVYVSKYKHCLVCGERCEVVHHYIQKRQSNNTRYLEANLVPLCNSCHYKHHTLGDSFIQHEIERKMGTDWADNLQIARHKTKKLGVKELKEIIADLEAQL
jgi:hypothetical protein